jgi:hypothetical protein
VLLYPNGDRLKIKFENYVKLHKIVSNLSVQNLFDWLKTQKPQDELMGMLPDEFFDWYTRVKMFVDEKIDLVKQECLDEFTKQVNIDIGNRAQFAARIASFKYKSMLFKMYSGTSISDLERDIYWILEKNGIVKELEQFEMTSKDTIQYRKYKDLYADIQASNDKIICDITKPKCIIFDIDGTLATKYIHRTPYDICNVDKDTLNEPVYEIYKCIKQQEEYTIIICTGRSVEAYDSTIKWLEKYDINYKDIHFRPYKNYSSDYLIKEKMWRKISQKYNIITMFDDRKQVVDHARKLGLHVCQVDVCQVDVGDF